MANVGQVIGTPYNGTHTLGNWQSDNAYDLSAPVGTPVRAAVSGRISRAGVLPGEASSGSSRFAGYRVQIDGSGNSVWYGHLSRMLVRAGETVQTGQVIGYSGSANGVEHLHFAALHNPSTFIRSVLGGGTVKGTVTKRARGRNATPADWLKQAGWPSNLIPTMVAIGGAESGWNVSAVSPENDNGTKDFGWLQVNSVHGADEARLTSDPVYTARVAYQIYKEQGLGAWSTYNNGAYKSFMGETPNAQPGRVRPGGDPGGEDGGSGPDTELVAFWDHLPSLPNPIDLFKGAGKAINSTQDFMKWIAWIFHPLNLLRMVEFWAGFNFIIMGFVAVIMAWKGAGAEDVVSIMPQGRALKAAKAAKGAKAAKATRGAAAARGTARAARPEMTLT